MQRKSNKKTENGQALPELTPEQKQIKLLEKRLKKEKATSEYRRQWWIEAESVAKKYQKEIEEWRIACSAYKSMASINETNAKTWETICDTYQSMNAKIEKDNARLKAEAEKWKALCSSPAKDSRTKFNPEDPFGIIEELRIIEEVPAEDKTRETISDKPRVKVNLICISAGDSGQLDEFSRYTSPGPGLYRSGKKFYRINECQGAWFPAELFHISTAPVKLGETFTELQLLAKEAQERANQGKKD